MTEDFIGIDVAFGKGKRLPVVVCTGVENRLVPLRLRGPGLPLPPMGRGNAAVLDSIAVASFVEETIEYLNAVCAQLGVTPTSIAIDAPSAPRKEGEPYRAAEKALLEAKIFAFSTPSRSEIDDIMRTVREHLRAGRPVANLPYANKLWMVVGFALFERLASFAPCIEVFPNAIARTLGCTLHKSKPGGVEEQLRAAAKHTGWPDQEIEAVEFSAIAWCPAHDRLDAYLSAWVASLSPLQTAELPRAGSRWAYGDPSERDAIWVPVLTIPPLFPKAVHPVYAAPRGGASPKPAPAVHVPVARTQESRSPGPLARVCPACLDKLFVRWPWGWDGHAAYACSALTARGPQERKQEFRNRFGHLFGSTGATSTAEDREDLAAFEERAGEPDVPFRDVVADLASRGKL